MRRRGDHERQAKRQSRMALLRACGGVKEQNAAPAAAYERTNSAAEKVRKGKDAL